MANSQKHATVLRELTEPPLEILAEEVNNQQQERLIIENLLKRSNGPSQGWATRKWSQLGLQTPGKVLSLPQLLHGPATYQITRSQNAEFNCPQS